MELTDQLWGKAKLGALTDEEAELAAQLIQKSADVGVQSALIYTLGRAGAMQYQSLLESFLLPDADGTNVRASLVVLVTDWGLSSPAITKTVKEYILGADWDEHGEFQELSISLAGSITRSTGDRELFSALLRMAQGEIEIGPTEGDLQEFGPEREYWDSKKLELPNWALEWLAYALGYSHGEISESKVLVGDLRSKWEQRMAAEAAARLGSSC